MNIRALITTHLNAPIPAFHQADQQLSQACFHLIQVWKHVIVSKPCSLVMHSHRPPEKKTNKHLNGPKLRHQITNHSLALSPINAPPLPSLVQFLMINFHKQKANC